MRAAIFLGSCLALSAACDETEPTTSELPMGGSGGSTTSTTGGAGGAGAGDAGAGGQAGGSGGSGGAVQFTMTDTLKNGGTMGTAVGGTFGPDGWEVTANNDRIYYSIPRLTQGSIQFTMANVTVANLLVNDNEVFAMYDGGWGIMEPVDYNPEFRDNYYKTMIRIYGQAETGRTGQQKLMWGICPSGAPGYGYPCPCSTSFFEEPFGGDDQWDGTAQVLRVEWGNGITRYLRNGVQVHLIDWSATGLEFGPQELHFSLGTSRPDAVGTASMPIGAVFSDVVVEGYEGPEATCR